MATPEEHKVETEITTLESITDAISIANEEWSDPPPTLTTIPTEIRLRILQEVVKCPHPLQFVTRRSAREPKFRNLRCRRVKTPILLCNKQLHYEALPEFFKQNTITFDPADMWNTLPPYAFVLIKHLRIKLDSAAFTAYYKTRTSGYIRLQYFQQLKTLTFSIDMNAAYDVLALNPLSHYYGMYNISVSEIVVEGGFRPKDFMDLMDNIKLLFETSKVGRFRRGCDNSAC